MAVVAGEDSHDAVWRWVEGYPPVGYGDDVQELLSDVGWHDNCAPDGCQGGVAEERAGLLPGKAGVGVYGVAGGLVDVDSQG